MAKLATPLPPSRSTHAPTLKSRNKHTTHAPIPVPDTSPPNWGPSVEAHLKTGQMFLQRLSPFWKGMAHREAPCRTSILGA